jgi:hypothetical protein
MEPLRIHAYITRTTLPYQLHIRHTMMHWVWMSHCMYNAVPRTCFLIPEVVRLYWNHERNESITHVGRVPEFPPPTRFSQNIKSNHFPIHCCQRNMYTPSENPCGIVVRPCTCWWAGGDVIDMRFWPGYVTTRLWHTNHNMKTKTHARTPNSNTVRIDPTLSSYSLT